MKKVVAFIVAVFVAVSTLHAGGDNFVLPALDGKSVHVTGFKEGFDLREFRGKTVFLEFWGTRCPPCLMSIPHYIDLQKRYKDKLAIVAIEVMGMPAEYLRDFVKAKGINYTVIPYEKAMPFVDYVQYRTGWKGRIPYLVILDRKGRYIAAQVGMLPLPALEGILDRLEKLYRKEDGKAARTPPKIQETSPKKTAGETATKK